MNTHKGDKIHYDTICVRCRNVHTTVLQVWGGGGGGGEQGLSFPSNQVFEKYCKDECVNTGNIVYRSAAC